MGVCSASPWLASRKGAKVRVKDWTDPYTCTPTRSLIQFSNKLINCWDVFTHEGCVHNEVRSLAGRVLREVPLPDPMMISELDYTTQSLAKRLDGLCYVAEQDQVLSLLPQKKRKLYLRELQSLSDYPLTKRDRLVKAFVKNEKLQILEKDGDPRMIQARTPRFNLVFATYTKPMEHALYTLKHPITGRKLIAKGLNLRQRAWQMRQMWESKRNPVSCQNDLSRFDAHVNLPMMECLHRFYLALIHDPLLRELLQVQLRNKGFTQHNNVYEVTASVMSGDMTTALGNCVLVAAVVLTYQRLLLQGSSLVFTKSQVAMLNSLSLREKVIEVVLDGDDHVMIMEKELLPLVQESLPKFWASLGHSLKIEGVTDQFERITFCQHRPFKNDHLWEMVPDPRKVLATSFVVTGAHASTNESASEYLGTLWDARAILHQGVPVLGPLFARLAKENTRRMRNVGTSLDGIERLLSSDGRTRVHGQNITAEKRLAFDLSWQIDPDLQRSLEEMIVPPPRLENVRLCQLFKRLPVSVRTRPLESGANKGTLEECWQ